MNNLPLQPLVWTTESDTPSAKSPLHYYDIIREYSCGESCFVRYQKVEAGCNIKQATGFSSFDEAKAWAWNHYNEKMQPHVKPAPTWIDVNERLPEEDGLYLAYYPDQTHKQKIVFFSSNINRFNYFHDLVTHWQLLPNPPEGE